MKTIICDRCGKTGGKIGFLFRAYNVEFGEEPIFGKKNSKDLCEQCLQDFMNLVTTPS